MPWLWVALLTTATGLLAGHLVRILPRAPAPVRTAERDPRAKVESFLGLLASGITRVFVEDREAAQRLLRQVEVASRDEPALSVVPITHGDYSMRFSVRVVETLHVVELWWPPPPPRLAVVVDDLGGDLGRAEALLDLEIPITPSIIPHLCQSREVAEAARDRGRAFLLHLPMQPRGYPEIDPGRGALLEGMSEPDIRRTVAEDLAAVPGVSGVNNHMGSRFTELEEPLRWVMDELAKRELFFLDSVTSPATVAATVARESGLATVRRDVFIDNNREVEAIGRQIDAAVAKARQNGRAVAIGHPYPETLEALRQAAARIRAEGVRVVPLGELVTPSGGS
ncbi:MAG: divergent polysaccharide deacetylase family protein [Thermodesulfobacteriota bacterium]